MTKGKNLTIGKDAKKGQDPIQKWIREAEHHYSAHQFLNGSPVEIMGIIQNFYGRENILRQIESVSKIRPMIENYHPVVGWIATPSRTGIASLTELALYLKDMINTLGMEKVIEHLKNRSQFHSASLQLAFGYRFFNVGAKNLEFEPKSKRGLADIKFEFEGKTFLIECFFPKTGNKAKTWYSELIDHSSQKILRSAEKLNKRIIVFIRAVNNSVTIGHLERKHIESKCFQLIREISPGDHLATAVHELEISVRETSKLNISEEEDLFSQLKVESVCGVNKSFVSEKDLNRITRGENVEHRTSSRLLIGEPDESPELERQIEKLAQKVESKVIQVRESKENVVGLLIVRTHHARPDKPHALKFAKRLESKILKNHEGVEEIILTTRAFTGEHRPIYTGIMVDQWGQNIADSTVRNLRERLASFEQKNNVLKAWE